MGYSIGFWKTSTKFFLKVNFLTGWEIPLGTNDWAKSKPRCKKYAAFFWKSRVTLGHKSVFNHSNWCQKGEKRLLACLTCTKQWNSWVIVNSRLKNWVKWQENDSNMGFLFMGTTKYIDIDQGIYKVKLKVALNEKQKKLHGFSFSISMANFEAFWGSKSWAQTSLFWSVCRIWNQSTKNILWCP